MSDRLLDACIATVGAIMIVALGALLVREARRPAPACADYATEPGHVCRLGAALVVEGGVPLCRCPRSTP